MSCNKRLSDSLTPQQRVAFISRTKDLTGDYFVELAGLLRSKEYGPDFSDYHFDEEEVNQKIEKLLKDLGAAFSYLASQEPECHMWLIWNNLFHFMLWLWNKRQ